MVLFDELVSELIAKGTPAAEVHKNMAGKIKEYINGIKKLRDKNNQEEMSTFTPYWRERKKNDIERQIIELKTKFNELCKKYSSMFEIKSAGCSLKMEQLSNNLEECKNCKERKDIERIPCEGDEVLKKPEKKDKS